jgi:hypothetical protein
MHNGALRKMALALTFWLALHVSSLRAQIFTAPLQASTTGTNPVDFEFRADGTLIAKGNLGVGSLLTGDQGAGIRMLWFPSLSAFRAGTVTGTDWDSSNIGQYSFAGGRDTTASGTESVAIGNTSSATGYTSMVFGNHNTSSGYSSFAAGRFNIASGQGSTAIGTGNTASNYGATAIGNGCSAYQSGSTALGNNNWARAQNATALGNGTQAAGVNSTSSGLSTTAQAYCSFVIGAHNLGGGTTTSWVATDPLFEIGNGTTTTNADALIVYKNGNAILVGTLQVAPGGDIPMFTGN